MNLVELQRKLTAAARANPPGDRVPFAFEKRVMACLAARRALDCGAYWVRALWRGAVSCVALTLLLSAWSFLIPASSSVKGDLSQDFENAVLVPASNSAKGNLSKDFEDAVFAAVDQESNYSW